MDKDKNKAKNSLPSQSSPSVTYVSGRLTLTLLPNKASRKSVFLRDSVIFPNTGEAISRFRESIFIDKVKEGMVDEVEGFIQGGINLNAQDNFGMTALHHSAATGFRPCIRLLVNSGKCNYLLKDNKGRLASELAYEWGRDYAVGLLLQKKEAMQAYLESLKSPPDTSEDKSS
ncbi:ankyrin repeat domain-containing protein [Pseudomonas sp. Irchel 3A7]|uniref:ankyrin repeat domain-containing protein n=1 Tax=Pseudomonas sp. Irchel 3A7 TaxID=2008913 RepID=UPI0021156D36|nr:ankyrin repeat domain-containing protein [Pseudomonas sp. Irchel 3A7]